jgi:hypothetical protein
MNTNPPPNASAALPDAVCPGTMNYGAEAPAFVLNPQASKQDLLSWCAVESQHLRHLASVGQNEVFADDALLTIQQLDGRLHVLSGILGHIAEQPRATSPAAPPTPAN